jgi:MFS family permease
MHQSMGVNTGALTRYASAAILVRAADAGAAVGLILLAFDPTLHISGAGALGGLLVAALTAPHLVAPWVGERLERSNDGRGLLAVSYLWYALALGSGALLLGHTPVAVPLGLITLAGLCGPLLTGGLSSRLPAIAAHNERAQSRAQGIDALTYGVGGTLGPVLVAGLSALAGPRAALLGLCSMSIAAAMLTLTLPGRPLPPQADPATPKPSTSQRVRAGLRPLITNPPLRRVSILTLVGALGTGGLPVITASLGIHLSNRATSGAILLTALGAGSLLGSLLVTVFPLTGEPEVLALRHFSGLTAVTAACALAPTILWSLISFMILGVVQATFFTTTLAARAQYSPPSSRAQVFVTSAGLKVAVSSLGAAIAGLCSGFASGQALLLAVAALTAIGLLSTLADRMRSKSQPERNVHQDIETSVPSPTRSR